MADEYGSDFMTIIDEDGTEFELEIYLGGGKVYVNDFSVKLSVEDTSPSWHNRNLLCHY